MNGIYLYFVKKTTFLVGCYWDFKTDSENTFDFGNFYETLNYIENEVNDTRNIKYVKHKG